MSKRRVVITGLGMISPLGNTVAETWQGILAGKSGVRLIEDFDASSYACRFAATVKGFNADEIVPVKEQKKMDIFVTYGLAATKEALVDSGLVVNDQNAHRIGVCIGSGIGGITNIQAQAEALMQHGPRRVSPFFIPSTIINMISGYASIYHNLRGPNLAVVTACTTGTHAIGLAARTIAYGDADVMLAGGSEKASSPMGVGGFCAARALSTRNDAPTEASRPWDKDRDGFVLGDGAGVLVLEEYEHAKKRGAKIYAELAGFGMSGDAYHITLPSGTGASQSMQNALNDAGIVASSVDYINAHGTSTPAGDVAETKATKATFQDHAYKLAVSSTKSMVGHLLGAAGAVEAIFSILAIRDQVAPPTINLYEPDPENDLDYVPHEARQMKIDYALSNSFGFGGTNGSLIFKKV